MNAPTPQDAMNQYYLCEARDSENGTFEPLFYTPVSYAQALRSLEARAMFYRHAPNVLREDADKEGFVVLRTMSAGGGFVAHVRVVGVEKNVTLKRSDDERQSRL